jgi:uncharacterized protein Smg (DUF494 family)
MEVNNVRYKKYDLEEFEKYLEKKGFDKKTISKFINFLKKMEELWSNEKSVDFSEEEMKNSEKVLELYYNARQSGWNASE